MSAIPISSLSKILAAVPLSSTMSRMIAAVMVSKPESPKAAAVLLVAMTYAMLSYDKSIFASTVVPMVIEDLGLNATRAELLDGIGLVGVCLGSLIGGILCHHARLQTVMIPSLVIHMGSNILMTEGSFIWILTGRLFSTMALGNVLLTAPFYANQVSDAVTVGLMSLTQELSCSLGSSVANFVSYATEDSKNKETWKVIVLLNVLPSLLVFGLTLFLTRYSNEDQLGDTREGIRGHSQGEELQPFKNTIREAFKTSALRNMMILCFITNMLQHFTGFSTLEFFTPHLYNSVVKSSEARVPLASLALNAGIPIIQGMLTLLGANFLNSARIRPLLLTTVMGLFACLLTLGSAVIGVELLSKEDLGGLIGLSVIIVITICISVSLFTLGVGALPWIVTVEILPPAYQVVGSSVSVTTNTLSSAIASWVFMRLSVVFESVGCAVLAFASATFISFFFYYFFLPESRGENQQQLELELA